MAISQVNSFSLARLSASGHRQFSMDDARRHRGPTALARGPAALETADLTGGDTAEPATVARGSRRRTRVDGPGRGRGRRPQRVDPNRRLFTTADSNGYQQHIVKVAVLLHENKRSATVLPCLLPLLPFLPLRLRLCLSTGRRGSRCSS